jgi:hypothetical protein
VATIDDLIPLLEAIIYREQADGCPMATERLIAIALRRWKSYDRRFKRHTDKSLEHRAHDLDKGLRKSCPNHSYDPGCTRHLVQSFAEVLLFGSENNSAKSQHLEGTK